MSSSISQVRVGTTVYEVEDETARSELSQVVSAIETLDAPFLTAEELDDICGGE